MLHGLLCSVNQRPIYPFQLYMSPDPVLTS